MFGIAYAMNTLTKEGENTTLPEASLAEGEREREWVNLGGQLVPQQELDKLINQIESGAVDSWQQVHECYDQWWEEYPALCRRHAYQVLCLLSQSHTLTPEQWQQYLLRYGNIQHFVAEQVKVTRQKDDENLEGTDIERRFSQCTTKPNRSLGNRKLLRSGW